MSKSINLKLEGMSCGHCAMTIQKALADTADVTKAEVNYEKKEAHVIAEETVTPASLIKVVEDAGYSATFS